MSAKKLSRKNKIALNRQTAVKPSVVERAKKSPDRLGYLLAVIALVLYAGTIDYQYTLDDYSVIIENNSTRKGAGAMAEFFNTSYRYGYIFASDELYRPLSKFVLALQWSISPENPMIGHLFNVLLYSLTALIGYRFLKEISKGKIWFAFFTTLLFTVHPLHTEVVASIKSIDEILGFLFGILSMQMALRYCSSQKTKQLVLSSLYFLLALFSKESSITFILLIPLMIYFFTAESGSKKWLPVAGSLLVTLIFFAMRTKALGSEVVSLAPSFIDNMLVNAPSSLERFSTAIYIIGLYLYKIFVPYPLSFDNSFPQIPYQGLSDWGFWVSFLSLAGMLAYAIWNFKKKSILVFGLLFFFISFSISSNIFITIGTHYGERLFYTASFGCIIALIALIDSYLERKSEWKVEKMNFTKLPALICIAVALVFSIITVTRNGVWYNNTSLYESGLVSAPKSTRVQFYMGNHMMKDEYMKDFPVNEQDKILDDGIAYLKKATTLTPSYADAWNKLGIVYLKKKNYEEAIKMFEKAISNNDTDPVFYNNLGTAYFNTQQFDIGFKQFQKAIALNPRYVDALMNIGSYYGTLRKSDEAIRYFNEAIKYDPANARAHYFLGLAYQDKGDLRQSKEYLDKAYELDPGLKK
jgi:tetratricopeptide (TPR) repeat protein